MLLMGAEVIVVVGCMTLGYVMGYAAASATGPDSSRLNIVDRLISPKPDMGKREFSEADDLDALMDGREQEDRASERIADL